MKPKTAKDSSVNWLADKIDELIPFVNEKTAIVFNELVQQAKEIDKEQKKYFFDCGRQYQLTGEGTFTEVYTETYKHP
jgi:hypothetical protein